MILENKGERLGSFTVGGTVIAVSSAYSGLYGTISSIYTDEDKETENPDADIYVDFVLPADEGDKAIFECLYHLFTGESVKAEDIWLDSVIMGPEMLMPVDM